MKWSLFGPTYYTKLKIAPEEYNLFLTESRFTSRKDRKKTLEMVFETFNCTSTYLVAQSCLAAFSVGKSTGISIDYGHTSLNFAPNYDEFFSKTLRSSYFNFRRRY